MALQQTLIAQTSDERLLEIYHTATSMAEFYTMLGYKKIDGVGKKHKIELDNRLAPYNLSLQQFKQEHFINIAKPKQLNACLYCGKPTKNKYCSHKCQKAFRDAEVIKRWKETGNTSCAPQTTIRNAVRDYIYQKQNNQCAICGLKNVWNGQRLNFVLDHIDGNAANGCEENLRLICPNCNSQLPTFKSRNKGSARAHRRKE